MVIDSSALVAILLREPGWAAVLDRLDAAPQALLSAANAFETAIVMETQKGAIGGRDFDLFLHEAGIGIVSVTREHFELARDAWRRFGKGRHPAALNICDCLAYALAKSTGEPLLFVGDDFTRTDVAVA
ncbi:MAG: type II toxin-antitoxin system VapC family toxin [Dongiaceae bacterium]